MRYGKSIAVAFAFASVCAVWAECVTVGLHKSAPERHLYVLDASSAKSEQTPTSPTVETPDRPSLEVHRFSISPLFATREFVYRTGETSSHIDYYNLFQIDPASMVATETRRWMTSSGFFGRVQEPGGLVSAEQVLEGYVSALYGDFGNSDSPAAVLEMQFNLFDDTCASPTLLLSLSYAERIAIDDDSPASLVEGWNEALRRILTQFEADLKSSEKR